jgi:hypothetical protein
VLRALGLVGGDDADLETALELARRSSDKPASARLAVELGRRRGNSALEKEGRGALEAMGDQLQLDRYGLG